MPNQNKSWLNWSLTSKGLSSTGQLAEHAKDLGSANAEVCQASRLAQPNAITQAFEAYQNVLRSSAEASWARRLDARVLAQAK